MYEEDYDHEYKLLKSGQIEPGEKTDDNFDRITTEDGSQSIVLDKSFMKSFNGFFDRGYEFEVTGNNFKAYNKSIFYFFADNTDVEWLYNEFTNTQTGERFGTLITSINKGTVQGASNYVERTLSNKDIRWDYNIHNHPSTEKVSDFHPSGWRKDEHGVIRKSTGGDRGFYNSFKTDSNYNNRMPEFFDVYAPKINKNLRYNNEKYFPTN